MKILIVEGCLLCPFYFIESKNSGSSKCLKVLRRFDSEFNGAKDTPDWCPLPTATPDFVDLFYKPKLTKAIAKEALNSGAKVE